jgi:hypothetical protein
MLFDVSPEEPVRSKGKRARAMVVATEEPTQTTQKAPIYLAKPRLGTIDGHYQCVDTACGAYAMDILDEHRGQWSLECAFCGTITTEPALVGHLAPQKEEFTFRDGRFAGLTISQAMEQPRGRDYVEWAAKDHTRPAVRAACRTHLDATTAGS